MDFAFAVRVHLTLLKIELFCAIVNTVSHLPECLANHVINACTRGLQDSKVKQKFLVQDISIL